jgi:hypothetical protein
MYTLLIQFTVYTATNIYRGESRQFRGTEREFSAHVRAIEATPGFVKWNRSSTTNISARPS